MAEASSKVTFDNRISWMDIVAISGVAVSGLYVVFGHGSQIDALAVSQNHLQSAIVRVEEESKNGDRNIASEIREQRKEQKQQFDKLDQKLDRIIDRELDKKG